MSKAIKLGISIGDINGVGLEVILKSFKDKRMLDFCTPILFGDYQLAMNTKKQLGLEEINLNKIQVYRLVLQGAMAKGGDVFVLDMGEPVRILDLAYRMINLSGLSPITNENPEGDIKVVFTGLRLGEKLYEELLIGHDVIQSEHPQIMQANEAKLSWEDVQECIMKLTDYHANLNEEDIRSLLLEKVEGYQPVNS